MENTPSFAVTEGALVTLVVPMYNVAPYLERCLRSLERQTYRNIEVIIMDDCSTDGSLDIASKMAASDMRFKVFQYAPELWSWRCAAGGYRKVLR